MALAKGSLVLVDYESRAKGEEEAIETTRTARHDRAPAPRLVAVGEGWVLRGLDAELAGMSVGERRSIEVPPEGAYGARDPKKVRMVPLRKLGDDAEKVAVGDELDLDGRRGTIRYIGSGRVQVDYNHRHAGKTIIYDMHVVRELAGDADKASAIVDRGMEGVGGAAKATVALDGDTLEVEIPQELFRAEGLQAAKQSIRRDMFRFVPVVRRLRFVEEHLADPPKPTATRAEFLAAGTQPSGNAGQAGQAPGPALSRLPPGQYSPA